MSHILLRLNGSDLAQFPDTEFTVTRNNPYFNDGAEIESYPFAVPLDGNRQHFQNSEVIESDATIHPVRGGVLEAIVDGIPVISGKCGSIEDQELTDRVSLKLESAVHTLDEYLDGVRCRDVELKDEILIGETIGNLKMSLQADLKLVLTDSGNIGGMANTGYQVTTLFTDKVVIPDPKNLNDPNGRLAVQLPALGFSRPAIYTTKTEAGQSAPFATDKFDSFGSIGVDPDNKYRRSFINVDKPYPLAPYCNARISYLHYREGQNDNESSDQVDTRTDQIDEDCKYNPYLMLEADRPASGLCFYVLYFLDCLFARLANDGIYYDNSELLKVDDLCRLAFFTTHCKFDVQQRTNPTIGPMHLDSVKSINSWLHSRNIDTTLAIDDSERSEHINSITIDDKTYEVNGPSPFGFSVWEDGVYVFHPYTIKDIQYKLTNVKNCALEADVMAMYANSQNFPDADAKEIIDNMWGAFGVRFYLDPDTRIVKPRFIRDILRDQTEAIVFPCTVITAVKQTEDIRGFRMQYSGTSDEQQRDDNITLGVRDYDTVYDYQDYTHLDASHDYIGILTELHDSNMKCYVDVKTGNRFRVKIDVDAEDEAANDIKNKRKNLAPQFFEVAQLSPVEVGDCSDENKDFIVEVTNSFQPIIFNDLNYREESKAISAKVFTFKDGAVERKVRLGVDGPKKQILSTFVAEDMWHENVKRRLLFPMGAEHVQFKMTADIKTKEAFDPTSSNDGDSPLQHAAWGLAVAIMRGGGSDSRIDYYDFDYDGFGNCKYRSVAGTDYTLSLDSIDCYSQVYDYNGEEAEGTSGERFSLKLRAYIPAPYDIMGPDGKLIPAGEPLCSSDPAIRNRGLFDTFFSEYAHWLLNRKKVKLTILCEVAALINIQWHKRYRFGDYVGFINKLTSHYTAENGLESVEVELFI